LARFPFLITFSVEWHSGHLYFFIADTPS